MKTFSLKEWGEQVINDPNPKKTIGWSVDKRNNASHNFQQLAELWACTLSDGKKNKYRELFEKYLLQYAIKNSSRREITGFPYLIASIIQLAYSINYNDVNELKTPLVKEHLKKLEKQTQVFTLITHDDPCRIYSYFEHKYYQNDQEDICGALIENYFQKEFTWKLDKSVEGNSWMLSVIVSAVVKKFPHLAWNERIGCTGVIQENGKVDKIEFLPEKLERFFFIYPKGIVIFPSDNINDIPSEILESHQDQLWAISSITELLCHLGKTIQGNIVTKFWNAKQIYARDWQGKKLDKAELLTLGLSKNDEIEQKNYSQYYESDRYNSIFEIDTENKNEKKYLGSIIKGDAGYGKTILLCQCYYHLIEGAYRYKGIPLFLKMREWGAQDISLKNFIARQFHPKWTYQDFIGELERYHLSERIWLLIDGFDEINESRKAELEKFLYDHNFFYILTTRGLVRAPNTPQPQIFKISKLSKENIEKLLRFYHREDILKCLSQAHNKVFDDETLDSWCTSPLNVSILANTLELPLENIILRDWIKKIILHWILRAEAKYNLSPQQIKQYEQKGSLVLGRASFQMFKEERLYLEQEDLRLGVNTFQLSDSEMFQDLIEKTGFLIHFKPGAWEFSHKQIAEYIAADYLNYKIEKGDYAFLDSLNENADWLFSSLAIEILIFLSQMSKNNPKKILNWLEDKLDTYYFDTLHLVTRILAIIPKEYIDPDEVIKWMKKRIVLASYFPGECDLPQFGSQYVFDRNHVLPFRALDRYTDIVFRKWHSTFKENINLILNDCAPSLVESFKRENHNTLTVYFVKTFKLTNKLISLLCSYGDTSNFLSELKQGKWANSFEKYFDHKSLGYNAKEYFFRFALPEDILRYLDSIDALDKLDLGKSNVYRILNIVAKYGTTLQQKEGLIRFVIYSKKNNELVRFENSSLDLPDTIDSSSILKYWSHIWEEVDIGKYIKSSSSYSYYRHKTEDQFQNSIGLLLLTQIYSTDAFVNKSIIFTALRDYLSYYPLEIKQYNTLVFDGLKNPQISDICWEMCLENPILKMEQLRDFFSSNSEKEQMMAWQIAYKYYKNYSLSSDVAEQGISSSIPVVSCIALAYDIVTNQNTVVVLEDILIKIEGLDKCSDEKIQDTIFNFLLDKYSSEIFEYFSNTKYKPFIKKILDSKLSYEEVRKRIVCSKDEELREYLVKQYVVRNKWDKKWKSLLDYLKQDRNPNIINLILESHKSRINEKKKSQITYQDILLKEKDKEKRRASQAIIDKFIQIILDSEEVLILDPQDDKTFYLIETALYHDIESFWNAFKAKDIQRLPTWLPTSLYPPYGDDFPLALEDYMCNERPRMEAHIRRVIINRMITLLEKQTSYIPSLIRNLPKVSEDNYKFFCLMSTLFSQDLEPYWSILEPFLLENPQYVLEIVHLVEKTKLRNRFEEILRKTFPERTFPYNKEEKLMLKRYIEAIYTLGKIDSLAYILQRTDDIFSKKEILRFALDNSSLLEKKHVPSFTIFAKTLLKTADKEEQVNALKALAYFGEKSDRVYGLEFLHNPYLPLVLESLNILYSHNSEDILQDIIPYLKHPELSIVTKALQILERWGDDKLWSVIWDFTNSIASQKEPHSFHIQEDLDFTFSEQDLCLNEEIISQWESIDHSALDLIIKSVASTLSPGKEIWVRKSKQKASRLLKSPCLYFQDIKYDKILPPFSYREWENVSIFLFNISQYSGDQKTTISQLFDIMDYLKNNNSKFLFILTGLSYNDQKDIKNCLQNYDYGYFLTMFDDEIIPLLFSTILKPFSLNIPNYKKLNGWKASKVCIEYENDGYRTNEYCWIDGFEDKYSNLLDSSRKLYEKFIDSKSYEKGRIKKYLLQFQGLPILELGSSNISEKISCPCIKDAIKAKIKTDKKEGLFQGTSYYSYYYYPEKLMKQYSTDWKKEVLSFVFSNLSSEATFHFAINNNDFLQPVSIYSAKEFFDSFTSFGRLKEHILFLISSAEFEDHSGTYSGDVIETYGIDIIKPVIDEVVEKHGDVSILNVLLSVLENDKLENEGVYKIVEYLGGVKEENIEILKKLYFTSLNKKILQYLSSIPSLKAKQAIVEVWKKSKVSWL